MTEKALERHAQNCGDASSRRAFPGSETQKKNKGDGGAPMACAKSAEIHLSALFAFQNRFALRARPRLQIRFNVMI